MAYLSNLRYNLYGDNMIVKNIKFINNKVQINLDTYSFFISKENYIMNLH